MSTYVWRNGGLVDRRVVDMLDAEDRDRRRAGLPCPHVSRFEAYESPVTERTISSDRQREMDLFKSNSYDERDIGPNHPIAKAKKARKQANAARSTGPDPEFWR